MKSSIKRITCGLLIALAVVCLSIFAFACNKDKGDGNAYTVCIVYPDGTAVNGQTEGTGGVDAQGNDGTFVQAQFCEVDANHNELRCLEKINFGADGKVSKSDLPAIESGHSWHVKLDGLPAGYTFVDDNYMSKPGTLTIKLVALSAGVDNTTAYSVTAQDSNGNPVADVWFQIGYLNNYTFVAIESDGNYVVGVAKSNAQGVATFKIVPEDDKTYEVRIADAETIDKSYDNSIPYGYSNSDYSVEYTDGKSVIFLFNYLPNSVYYNRKTALDYQRVYDATEGAKEIKGVNKFNLEKDRHFYFFLLTYREIGGNSKAEVDANQKRNTQAAAGVYDVTFTTASSANVTMYHYEGSAAYVYTDSEGIPASRLATTDATNHTITINLTIADNISRMSNYFGIYADADCEVEITVTRTGDATEPAPVVTKDAEYTAPAAKYGNVDGKLALMPVNGTLKTVYNETDKYYHVGTQNGPLLLVTLTKPLSRVGNNSIAQLPNIDDDVNNPRGKDVYAILDGNVRTDYYNLVTEYSKWVNDDGVYPVNEDLYGFLKATASLWATAQTGEKGDYNWLIPCQYYVPADGFDASGAGTQADPYELVLGTNKLNNSAASVYVTFTAPDDGAYTVTASSETFSGNTVKVGDKEYLVLLQGEAVTVQLTGADANTTVTIENAGVSKIFSATDDSGNSAADAQVFSFPGLYLYKVNEGDGVYVDAIPIMSGTYTVTAYGGTIEYNNTTNSTQNFEVVANQHYVMYLGASVNGLYILNVEFGM